MDRGAWWATVHRVAKSDTRSEERRVGTGLGFLSGSVVKKLPAMQETQETQI